MAPFETLWQQTWKWMHLIINVYNTLECQSRRVKMEAVREGSISLLFVEVQHKGSARKPECLFLLRLLGNVALNNPI